MYLTSEELIILQGLKENLGYAEISRMLNEPLRTCDGRVNSLYQKYGVDNRHDLVKRANLDKVEVARIENIPYWQYEGTQLVQKIPVCKRDVKRLLKLLEQEETRKSFNLVYSSNYLYKFMYLEKSNKKEYIQRNKIINMNFYNPENLI